MSRLYNRYIPGAGPSGEHMIASQDSAPCTAGSPAFSEVAESAQPSQKAGSMLKGLLGGILNPMACTDIDALTAAYKHFKD